MRLENDLLAGIELDKIQLPLHEPIVSTPAIPWFDIDGNGVVENGQQLSLNKAMISTRWAAGGLLQYSRTAGYLGKSAL